MRMPRPLSAQMGLFVPRGDFACHSLQDSEVAGEGRRGGVTL